MPRSGKQKHNGTLSSHSCPYYAYKMLDVAEVERISVSLAVKYNRLGEAGNDNRALLALINSRE